MNLETEGKLSFGKLVTFRQQFVTQSRLPLIFTKTLLLSHKRAYFSHRSHDTYKDVDGNSKLNITKLMVPEN